MVIKEYLNLVKETLRHKHLTQVNLFFFFFTIFIYYSESIKWKVRGILCFGGNDNLYPKCGNHKYFIQYEPDGLNWELYGCHLVVCCINCTKALKWKVILLMENQNSTLKIFLSLCAGLKGFQMQFISQFTLNNINFFSYWISSTIN